MTDLQNIPLDQLHPHPDNPRLQLREDVLERLVAEMVANGFGPEHAILARPHGDGWQLISGHHRAEAARRAGLVEVPTWVREMDDDEAFMQLVLIAVTIVDYKHFSADIAKTNSATFNTLSQLYGPDHNQLPFFVARYWPDTWAFKLLAVNDAAKEAVQRVSSGRFDIEQEIPLTEQQYVTFLYRLRKDALTLGDRRCLARLNQVMPPPEAVAS